MGILTNFLKLLKPEPNDFVNVAKHISENYDKLDLNAKSNNETLTNLSNNKLDKGTYSGDAGKLKEDIDEKMSKYQSRYDIMDYDDLIEDGFYRAVGTAHGAINVPSADPTLVQVWDHGSFVYQNVVSYHDVSQQFTRCFKKGTKNTKWERIINTANYSLMCPYSIGDIMLSASSQHPAVKWIGTTWEKIEGRFLLGSSSSYALGSTGGSATTTLTKANLPSEKLQLDSFSLGRGTQEITGQFNAGGNSINPAEKGAFSVSSSRNPGSSGNDDYAVIFNFTASKSWTGMSTSAAPYTTNMGDSTPFNNMPPYLVVNIWKRLT